MASSIAQHVSKCSLMQTITLTKSSTVSRAHTDPAEFLESDAEREFDANSDSESESDCDTISESETATSTDSSQTTGTSDRSTCTSTRSASDEDSPSEESENQRTQASSGELGDDVHVDVNTLNEGTELWLQQSTQASETLFVANFSATESESEPGWASDTYENKLESSDLEDENGDEIKHHPAQSLETHNGTSPSILETSSADAVFDDINQEGSVYFMRQDKCVLSTNVPETYYFEITDPDELDELLICELPEVAEIAQYTEEENRKAGRIWILKPSLTNQAKSIVVIPSIEKLREVFEDEDALSIRQWVIQRYICNPLLISGGRKFHIRCHVFAVGALTVYLSTRMLALFSLLPFNSTDESAPDSMHLTNVCYQKGKFVAENPDSTFDERMAVLLMEEALSTWALEHLYFRDERWENLLHLWNNAQSQARKNPIACDPGNVSLEVKEAIYATLHKSRSAFKYFSKRAGVDLLTKCDSNRVRQTQAELIAVFALAHIQEQIQSVLRELFSGCFGVHHVAPFVPALGTQFEFDPEITAARDIEAKLTLKNSSGSISMSSYRPIGHTCEMYGIDFMVDDNFQVYLLEVNAGPDFGQTGARLRAKVCRPMVRGMSQIISHHLFPQFSHRSESALAKPAAEIFSKLRAKIIEIQAESNLDSSKAFMSFSDEVEAFRDELVSQEIRKMFENGKKVLCNQTNELSEESARELLEAELAWLEGIDLTDDALVRGGVEVNLTARPDGMKSPAVSHFLPLLHIEASST